jgi:outer membrane protein OmpA-like peptidoglycan-associated protein
VTWQSVEDIAFEYSAVVFMPRCRQKIERLAGWAKQHPTVEVALGARFSRVLTGELYPLHMATERVRTVREAFLAAGVAPDQIHPTMFPQRAACAEVTLACYERNRRVEVFFGHRS